MPQALPYILGAQAIVSTIQSLNPPRPPATPPTLSWEQAMEQAQQTLNPLYDQALQDTLQRVALQNIRSGFFGQAPGSALSQDAAARLEANRLSHIGQLAQQMVGLSQEQALRQQALASQFALNQFQAQQSALPNLVNVGLRLGETFPQLFGTPNLGSILGAGTRAMQNTPATLSTPAESRLIPTFGNMGLANQMTLQPSFARRSGFGSSFANPYAGGAF